MPNKFEAGTFDCIVIGAGHAGVEAALAAARMGASTLVLNNESRYDCFYAM